MGNLLNPTNVLFGVVIVGIFVFAFLSVLSNRPSLWQRKLVSISPSLLTSIGVAGTFVGIFFGLLGFDVTAIDESVPSLLEGLKTAFLSSIMGLVASLVLRITQVFAPAPVFADAIDDPVEILKNMAAESKRQTNALTGDENGSLLSQIKLARSEANDASRKQIEAFQEFAKTMAEHNSKALIEALEQVIRDFNEKLTEQFGENFKQLNAGVEKLVGWQENYKDHVSTMEDRISAAVSSLESSEKALGSVAEKAEAIPKTMQELQRVVIEVNGSISALGDMLSGLGVLREQAIQAFPIIESNLQNISNKMSESASGLTEALDSSSKLMESAVFDASSRIEDMVNKTSKNLETQAQVFEDLMQSEVERVVKSMAGHFVAVSERIRSDYEGFERTVREVSRLVARNGSGS